MKKIKLHLGCRNDILDGYINIDLDDIQYIPEKGNKNTHFIQMDIMEVDLHFPVKGVDEIISRHLFEHLTHEQITTLLLKLWRILKPGGKLEITVPDFFRLFRHFRYEHEYKDNFSNLDIFHSRFFGIEEEGFHKTFWDEKIGNFYLTREGFFEKPCIIVNEQELEITFKTKKK